MWRLAGTLTLAAVCGCALSRGAIVPPGGFDAGDGTMDGGMLEVDAWSVDDAWSADDVTMPTDDVWSPPPSDVGPGCMEQCVGGAAVHCTASGAMTTPCGTTARCRITGGFASCVPLACTPSSTMCSTDGATLDQCDGAGTMLTMTPCPRGCVAGACRPQATCSATVGPTIVAPGSMTIDTCGQHDDDQQQRTHGDCPDHGPNGEDVVVRLDVNRTERVSISARDVGTGPVDPCIYVRTACTDPSSEVECNDDGGSTALDSQITDLVLSPGEYFLVVDAFNWNDGATHYGCGMIAIDVTVAPL